MTNSPRVVERHTRRSATSKLLRTVAVCVVFAAGAVGCAPKYTGPAVCGDDEWETLLRRQLSMWSPAEAFEITTDRTVFVAVVSDPRAAQERGVFGSVSSVYLLEDGAEPEFGPNPNFPESRMSLDPEIRFRELDEYRVIDAEPGSYRLYSSGSPTIAVVRCP